MQAKINGWLQYVLTVLAVVILLAVLLTPSPVVPTASEIAAAVVIPTMTGKASLDNDKIDAIYDNIFSEDNAEDVAEQLVLDELDTKDFKKDLISFLESEISVIQDVDYRDVEDIVVRDIDVEVDGEDATVELELKVYVSNYGDEDEEEKARITVVFNVEDLDDEEDYEDAEVDSYDDFELVRFYD